MDYNNGYYNGAPGYPQPYYNNAGAVPDRLGQYRAQYQQQGQPVQIPMQNMPTFNNIHTMPMNTMQPSPSIGDGRIWVQGEGAAKAYFVANGNSVELWDSENPVIYLKSADHSGKPSLRIFDINERLTTNEPHASAPAVTNIDYITRGEFDALKDKLNELLERENSRECETKPTENRANMNKSKEDKRNG